ncbi:MAG TPA: protein kinase [Planctomycetota bacterium]|nr:protein kinase [Planctomycetota bacterium]
MPSPQDDEFIRFAAASGHLTEEQAQEARSALRDIEALGGTATAPDLLLKRGLLTERQAALIHQAMAASKTATRVPRELGSFELIEKIGQGGMGSVFKARQKELGRLVALKILSPRLARSSEFVESFLREARAAGRLSHPNIVAAIDVGESQGFYYFAMEYVDGETVAKLLSRGGPLPEERALRIAADVARALDHAYSKGLIHRDIKPDNIMVTADGRVRVTDFGLAKAIGQGTPDGTDDERFMGTPAYVAPEQIRSEPDIGCRADIFSLGVTLFQMLTGELPFQGANPMAIAAAVVAEPLPALRKLAPDASPATVRVVERMTAKDPSHRYATPAELVAALESAASAPRAPAARVVKVRALAARPRRSNAPTVIAVGLILAVAVVAALAIALRPRRGGPRPDSPGEASPHAVFPPRTSVRPPPPDTSGAVAADGPMRDLLRAVERANKFEEQNPRDYVTLAARLRGVLDEFPPSRRGGLPPDGLDLLRGTEAKLKSVEARIEKALEAEFRERSARADAFLGEGKVNEALSLLDTFPNTLRTGAAVVRLEQLRGQWRRRAMALFDARDAQGKKLAADAQLDEAKALYSPYAACVVPEIAARAKEALQAIEQDYAKKLAEAKALARAAYVKEARAIFGHLDARELREARNLADAAVVSPALAPLRDESKDLQHLVRTVAEVWANAVFGVRKLKPGDKIRLGGLAGEVIEVRDDKVAMKIGNVTLAKRITDLRAADVVELALSGYGASSAATEAKLGLFLLAERDYDGARKRIAAARANGADVAREQALLARFAPHECPTCKGQASIACPDCGGKGIASVERQECDVCKGKGGGPCGYCHAKGRVRCANCNGTGRVLRGALPCNECGGTGWAKCSKCGGDGYLTCAKCKGTGVFTIVTPCARCRGNKSVPCPTCEGKGSLPPPDLVPPPEPPSKP